MVEEKQGLKQSQKLPEATPPAIISVVKGIKLYTACSVSIHAGSRWEYSPVRNKLYSAMLAIINASFPFIDEN